MSWQHGKLTIGGQDVQAAVKQAGGVLRVQATADLNVGDEINAFGKRWRADKVEHQARGRVDAVFVSLGTKKEAEDEGAE